MTARFNVTPKIKEQNRIVRTGKYEAEVINNVEKNCAGGILLLKRSSGPLATAELYIYIYIYTCFLHHRGIGDFRTFVSISLFSQFSYNQQPICTILGEMTDADEIMHPQFWDGYDGHPDPINPNTNPGSLLFLILALAEVCTQTEHSVISKIQNV